MNKKLYVSVLVLVLAIAGIWYAVSQPVKEVEQNQAVAADWKTYNAIQDGFEFKYPETLPTQYIHEVNMPGQATWPPTVTFNTMPSPFSCKESQGEIRIIGNRTFCVEEMSDAALGTTYTKYVYNTYYAHISLTFTFTLSYAQCANYDDPKMTECNQEREKFNPDALMKQIFSTFKVTEPTVKNLEYESEIITALKTNWQSVQANIPFRPTHPTTSGWGWDTVQFIGNDSLIVRFEDGYNPGLVVLHFEKGVFEIAETFENQGEFELSAWQNIVKKYGDVSYSISTYTYSLIRDKEIVSFKELTKVPENILVKNYWDN